MCTRFTLLQNKEHCAVSKPHFECTFKTSKPDFLQGSIVPDSVKTLERYTLCYPPKPLRAPSCTTSRVHDWKVCSDETKINKAYIPVVVVPNNTLQIDRTKPGYAKYLNVSATTHNSEYVEYSINSLGIGSKDHITLYNWKNDTCNVFKTRNKHCEELPEYSNCRKQFQSNVKAVPHGGQISEYRSSFGIVPSAIFDLSHIQTDLLSFATPVVKYESSNSVYGKGRRTGV